ncbi:HAD family hydrolase [Rugosimonospora africana]|uniref:Haloacid dehalogenase n=1 Tax=Rugosimonospora africana TaxID=556532 RepID=A0A8J3QKW3_9ACTN|nr:haloacid dehalogenase-like hydrolase [Rugosimonospora africana]GIH12481.1 haloacid dehalogenase [Rugosimonospora africana]
MTNDDARPRLILWDIDHTLIETRGAGGEFARAAFEEITGIRPEEMADANGKTERVILAESLRAHGIEPTDEHQQRYAQALPAQYQQHADHLRERGRALPGAAAAIAALAQVPGVIQTVLTGNYKAVAATKLQTFTLDSRLDFEVGAYADDGAERADLVQVAQRRAADKYGRPFTHQNTIVIGDTTHDVAAAHNGGARIVAIASGNDSAERLRAAGADRVFNDLTDTIAVTDAVASK